ncbi:MAG: helix-turn-helix domain-containing protein [Halobacteriales archaeon]|nr:helix-turn-helix domain-containing protein [Halobacteriales archaeon]
MSENRARDESGKFSSEVTDQDILKIFDRTGEPMTAPELAEELPLTKDGVTYRLKQMQEKGLVGRKEAGARAVVWWAKVAPELSDESKARVKESRKDIEEGNTVPLEEV